MSGIYFPADSFWAGLSEATGHYGSHGQVISSSSLFEASPTFSNNGATSSGVSLYPSVLLLNSAYCAR